jgi:hypothetical protein
MPVKKITEPKNYKPYSSTPTETSNDESTSVTPAKPAPKPATKLPAKPAPKPATKLPAKPAPKPATNRPKKGQGVSSFIIDMLLENQSTYDDIKKAIAKKYGAEAANAWKNRISMFRADINAGRRCAVRVAELKVRLPLRRLELINGKLVPVK